MSKTNLELTQELGVDFWNDSCDLKELSEAVAFGAVGATSNPVIVSDAVKNDRARWAPVLEEICRTHPSATEDEIAWLLIERVAVDAAALLEPVHDRTEGRKGFLSVQVSPKLYDDALRMTEQARHLASLAPNIAVKLPLTEAGVRAVEEVTASGVNVNATVSFSVAQAVAAAEAMERGLDRARASGHDMDRLHPYVTIMVGRVDDQLRRSMEARYRDIDPGHLHWGGVAVFKKAHALFLERRYRATLLAAAYRHLMHWTELIGDRLIQSIPYRWWCRFNSASTRPERTIDRPVPPAIVEALLDRFEDFRLMYDERSMVPRDFRRLGASVHTLSEFLGGYDRLLALVRETKLSA